jgi:pilus assembly protein CpaB
MNRRNRTLIVVGVAIVLASLASFGVYRAIQQIPVREVQIATNFAVVAKEAVPVGTLLTKDQLKVVPWPKDSPVPQGFSAVDDVVGRGVIVALVPNEPVTEVKLAPREAGGGLPPMIPSGMRAMSVKVNDVIGVAGYTVPGTRVDVVVTVKDRDSSTSRVVLDNIQVLTAGTMYDKQKSKDGQAIPSTVVTLLVTPHDAERLALAQNEGTIVLALRNPMDVDPANTNGVRMASLLGAPEAPPVKQVVKGQPRMVAPAPPTPAPRAYTVDAIRGGKRAEEVVQ